MKKNERAFLVNVMWVPLFVGKGIQNVFIRKSTRDT